MQIKRKFDEDGVTFESLMKNIISYSLEEIIDDSLLDKNYEGILGGNGYDNEASELWWKVCSVDC